MAVLGRVFPVLLGAGEERGTKALIFSKNGVCESRLGLYVLSGQLAQVEQQADQVTTVLAEGLLAQLGRAIFGDAVESILDAAVGGLSQLLGDVLVLQRESAHESGQTEIGPTL